MPAWKRKYDDQIVELLGGLGNGASVRIQVVRPGEPYNPGWPIENWPREQFLETYEPQLPKVDTSGIDAARIVPRAPGVKPDPNGPPIIDQVEPPAASPAMIKLEDIQGKCIEIRGVIDTMALDVRNMGMLLKVLTAKLPIPMPAPPAPPAAPAAPSSSEPTGS